MTLGLVLPLISSCIFEEVVIVEEEQDPVMVTFTLDVLSSTATKAEDGSKWGDNYDDDPDNDYPEVVGTGLENKIITSSVEVFAYDMEGNFKAKLPMLLCSENESGKVSFTCTIPKDKIEYEDGVRYKYVILANCTGKNYGIAYQGNTPNLEGLIYETPFSEVKPIPMWGVVSYRFGDDHTGEQNQLVDLKTVNLLRAAAKVGVRLSDDLKKEGYSIKRGSLMLNYARSTGYCIPNNWNSNNVWNTGSLAHAGAFRPTSAGLANDINASAESEDGGYYFYVPETENKLEDQLSLAVTLEKDDEEYEFTYEKGIKFCTYSDGLPTDDLMHIVRNHYYDFTITEVNVGMKVSLNVADWEDAPEWNLDFSAPVHTNLLVSPMESATDPMEEPTVAYSNRHDEEGAFVGYFKMESPEGVSWKPTLTNASAGDYEVRVYTNGQTNPEEYDIPVTDTEIMASENQFFKIVVVAKNPNLIDKVVKLGISYTASWNDENTLLIINKDEYGLYYPWVDNDPTDSKDDPDEHWISIKQVTSK